ncbi:MAG: DegT/DnrJ/EryC1/StrS family aminotransferase [Pseudomonadota bacterium]
MAERVPAIDFVDLRTQQARVKSVLNARIAEVLARGDFVLGREVGELERALEKYTGAKHCVTVANGTDALILGLLALGVGPGDEVITTPFSFAATVEAILWCGATPVFADIEPQTYNLNPTLVEQNISKRTKAILAVSLYGRCADFEALNEIAAKHGIAVIEDAAQSFGATTARGHSCALTKLACTSFYPSKPLGCYGDGGACFSDDDDIAEVLRQLRDHGQTGRYEHTRLGKNSRLDTIQAAVLLTKLEIFDDELEARRRVAEQYHNALAGAVGVADGGEVFRSAHAQFPIETNERDRLARFLTERGVPTSVHYPRVLYQQAAFAGAVGTGCVHAEAAAARILCLPMHPYLSDQEIEHIADSICEFAHAQMRQVSG